MPEPIKVLAFAGSLRSGSFNKKLVQAAAQMAKKAGAEVTVVDLRDFDMPLYDGDDEADSGIPEGALRFKQVMSSHDALLISAPEYNSSISGVLKNAIDWASRKGPGEAPLQSISGKVAGLLSASPGGLGGVRGLVTVRSILSNLNLLVIPEQFALVRSHEAFDENGNLKDPKQMAAVEKVVNRLVEVTTKLKA
ncbi:MAG TPA: NAD(P)H-dependent oxidoreductase [Terriglobales bacterium]|nr:NAD(P)H-dependent oxidoreductase [Terriglobales bacterium]